MDWIFVKTQKTSFFSHSWDFLGPPDSTGLFFFSKIGLRRFSCFIMQKIQKKSEKSILRFYIASRRTDESQIQRTLPLAAVQKRQFNGTRTT